MGTFMVNEWSRHSGKVIYVTDPSHFSFIRDADRFKSDQIYSQIMHWKQPFKKLDLASLEPGDLVLAHFLDDGLQRARLAQFLRIPRSNLNAQLSDVISH